MTIINLTYPIHKGMFKYPSDAEPEINIIPAEIEKKEQVIYDESGCSSGAGVLEKKYKSGYVELKIRNHHGTHIDAPAHKIPGGKTIDSYDINKFINKAFLIDLRDFKDKGQNYLKVIEKEHIEKKLHKSHANNLVDDNIRALVFYTGFCDLIRANEGKLTGQAKTDFEKTFSYFSEDAAQYLAENFSFLNIIGIDSFSVDKSGSNSEVHRTFFAKDILPLETPVNLAKLESLVGFGSHCFSYPPSRIFELNCVPELIERGDAAQTRAYAVIK